jgi:hypothetical protein
VEFAASHAYKQEGTMTWFSIVNYNSKLALDIHGGETKEGQTPGTPAVQYGVSPGAKTQSWQFVLNNGISGNGFLLKNEFGLALGPADNGWPWLSGQTPDPNQTSFNQQWSLLAHFGASADGGQIPLFFIVNLANTQQVVDVPTHGQLDGGSALDPGTQVQLYQVNRGANQLWTLQTVPSLQYGGPDAYNPALSVVAPSSPQGIWWNFEVHGTGFVGVSQVYLWLLAQPMYDGTPQFFAELAGDGVIAVNNGAFQTSVRVPSSVGPGIPADTDEWLVPLVATGTHNFEILALTTVSNSFWFDPPAQ